jgi:chorismate mutase
MGDDSMLLELRARIDAADRSLLAAVNERLQLVQALKRHKDANGIAFLDPDRERRLVELLDEANRGPLSSEGLRELFRFVLDLTKRELDASS